MSSSVMSATSSKSDGAKKKGGKSDGAQPAGAVTETGTTQTPKPSAGAVKRKIMATNSSRYLSLLGATPEDKEKEVGPSEDDVSSFSDFQWNGFFDAAAASKILLDAEGDNLDDGEVALRNSLNVLEAKDLEVGNLILALGSSPTSKEGKTHDPLLLYDLYVFNVSECKVVDQSVSLVVAFEGVVSQTITSKTLLWFPIL